MATSDKRIPNDLLEHAKALHKIAPLIDGHNDLPWKIRKKVGSALSKIDISKNQVEFHTDIPRLKEGCVGGLFWSVFVSPDLKEQNFVHATLEQIDLVYNMIKRYPETFQLTLTADEVEQAFQSGKIASLIGLEGGHSIGNSLDALRMFFYLGARYMTLTHNKDVSWAASATDGGDEKGFTKFGEEVINEMNRLGMIVDLSHVSLKTMKDVLGVANAPVIFSHSASRELIDTPRNVPDDVLKQLPGNGGIIMTTFVPGFISEKGNKYYKKLNKEYKRLKSLQDSTEESMEEKIKKWIKENSAPRVNLADVADHIDHIRSIISIDHIGIGSDFDGTLSVPEGLEDVSKFPNLTVELLQRGYSDDDILKILGKNILRVMREVEEVAKRMQKERGPSEATIEELDGLREQSA
ncbi:MAG: membrane dipeptidase [Candidatus Stahlbacteria bacterium]|nr:MAG: membrane dipeptidase [Candidatus Stahlbacteria bacterium]